MNYNTEQLNWLTLLRLSEQEIVKQSFQEKGDQIKALKSEVNYLKDLLANVVSVRTPQPQLQPSRQRYEHIPKRWYAK